MNLVQKIENISLIQDKKERKKEYKIVRKEIKKETTGALRNKYLNLLDYRKDLYLI